ncbi:MAG: hypothetical protein R3C68_12135 [Myxococcota bacterium]
MNDRRELQPSLTTYTLMQGAARRGHRIFLSDASDGMATASGEIRVHALELSPVLFENPQALAKELALVNGNNLPMTDFDVWLLRMNPARDVDRGAVYQTVLDLAILAKQQGVCVLNNPTRLRDAASKLYLHRFPAEFVPKTFVSNRPQALLKYLQSCQQPVVIKPLQGTRGRDVFCLNSVDDPNTHQLIDVVTRSGYAMVQDFVKDPRGGDLRVILVGGKILQRNGQVCALRRIPRPGDFRGNVHAGGSLETTTLSAQEIKMLEAVGPILAGDGMFLVAADCLGGKLLEANVFSPGGWANAERVYGVDFNEAVLAAL